MKHFAPFALIPIGLFISFAGVPWYVTGIVFVALVLFVFVASVRSMPSPGSGSAYHDADPTPADRRRWAHEDAIRKEQAERDMARYSADGFYTDRHSNRRNVREESR